MQACHWQDLLAVFKAVVWCTSLPQDDLTQTVARLPGSQSFAFQVDSPASKLVKEYTSSLEHDNFDIDFNQALGIGDSEWGLSELDKTSAKPTNAVVTKDVVTMR